MLGFQDMEFQTEEALQSYIMAIDNQLDYTLSLATQSSSSITGKGYYGVPVSKGDEVKLMMQIFDSTDEGCEETTKTCITES